MKQSSIIILLTVLMSMVSTKASAHDIEVKNSDGITIYYNWTDNHKNLAVTYKGSHFPRDVQSYSGNVVIPECVEYEGKTYNVTKIGDYAFYVCKNLSSVTIGKNITSIGFEAFYYCIGLKSVHISDLTAWCNIYFSNDNNNISDNRASNPLSYAHHLFLNGKEVKDLIIPDGAPIRDFTFDGCSSITSVIIPNSATSIGRFSFRNCSGLTSVTIPNCVTRIGDLAFAACSSLTSVTIGNSVTSIGTYAFGACTELTSITFPESIRYISRDAFKETAWYNNLPDGLVYTGLIAYKYKGTMPENTEIVLKEGTVSIGEWAFSGCSGMSISIPNSVTYIGENAFYQCKSLTSVHISDIAAWCNIDFALTDVSGFDYCFSNPLSYAEHLYLKWKGN